jgi:hypothetical protein
MQGILGQQPDFPPDLSVPLRTLIMRMLDKDPTTRISLQEIRLNPWIAGTQDGELLTRDYILITKLRTMDMMALDEAIAGEMRVLGYELGGLIAELVCGTPTMRTAVYRILMRLRTADDIKEWQNMRTLPSLPNYPSIARPGMSVLVLKTPSSAGAGGGPRFPEVGRGSEIIAGSARGQTFAPKFRKRGPIPKLCLTPVPVAVRVPGSDILSGSGRGRATLAPL